MFGRNRRLGKTRYGAMLRVPTKKRRPSTKTYRATSAGGTSLRGFSTETKIVDTFVANPTVVSSANSLVLNLTNQGSALCQRNGQRIVMTGIEGFVYLTLPINQYFNSPYSNPRVLLVYDAQTNNATAPITDILQSTFYSAGGLVTQDNNDNFRGLDNTNQTTKMRFKILYDKVVGLPLPSAQTGTPFLANGTANQGMVSGQQLLLKIKKRFRLPTFYKGTQSGALPLVSDIATGSLTLYVVSANSSAQSNTNNAISYRCNLRVSYVDI